MNYLTNEFAIELPEIQQDRSVNVLTLVEPERGTPFQIIVSRDLLLAGETLAQCFERQVGLLTRQAQVFKAVSRQAATIGRAAIAAMVMESGFTQDSKSYHQLQAMFAPQPPKLIVITLSSHVPIHAGHREVWSRVLDSVHLRTFAVPGEPDVSAESDA